MLHDTLFSIFLIFTGAAILSTIALITRQSMLVAYMLLGILLGPWGLKWVGNIELVRSVSDVGIIFLLFLLGLNLPVRKLISMFKKIVWVGILSSIVFAALGYGVAYFNGYSQVECMIVSAALMFSSTIIGIKLLPTSILHHQHRGEIMISILLLQDLLAIAVLVIINSLKSKASLLSEFLIIFVGFPSILLLAYLFSRFILLKLFSKFNRVREYMFLLAIAWCLVMMQLALFFKLSGEIGAFIAGISLASSSVSIYISEHLKPVRDFFLVMFFFSIGAAFDLTFFSSVIVPAIILVACVLLLKPVAYGVLLKWTGEPFNVSWEVGVRLAQVSEFSLIIGSLAFSEHLISAQVLYLIEAVTMLSFIVSSYWVVMQYPTPLATSNRLRRD